MKREEGEGGERGGEKIRRSRNRQTMGVVGTFVCPARVAHCYRDARWTRELLLNGLSVFDARGHDLCLFCSFPALRLSRVRWIKCKHWLSDRRLVAWPPGNLSMLAGILTRQDCNNLPCSFARRGNWNLELFLWLVSIARASNRSPRVSASCY